MITPAATCSADRTPAPRPVSGLLATQPPGGRQCPLAASAGRAEHPRHASPGGRHLAARHPGRPAILAIGLLTLGLLTAAIPGQAADPPVAPAPPRDSYQEAMQAFARGEFFAGIKRYYKFLLFTDRLVSKAVRRRDLQQAQAALQQAARTGPATSTAQLALTLIDRILEDWPTANRRIDLLRRQAPASRLLSFLKGEFLLAQQQREDASRVLGGLLAGNPGQGLALLTRMLLERHGGPAPPAAATASATTPPPPPPDPETRRRALLREAYHLWDAQDREAAVQAFGRVMNGFPDDPEAFQAAANLHYEMKRVREAESILRRWEDRTGRPLLPPLQEARILVALERFGKAVPLLEGLLRAEPDNEFARLLLAESLFQSGSYASAAVQFEAMQASDPLNIGIVYRLGFCLEATGHSDEAIALFQNLLRDDPGQPLLQMELAAIFERQGNLEEAATWYFRVSEYENPFQAQAAEKLPQIAALQMELAAQNRREDPQAPADQPSAHDAPFQPPPGDSPAGHRPLQAADAGKTNLEQVNRWLKMFD
ncbi:MAG: tetratricopeptide repeat protein [Candidatus Riflebacteria bacterium]|nr:tetratricopeptide repeat protein [Candidatus Riflebacteria bacterium]